VNVVPTIFLYWTKYIINDDAVYEHGLCETYTIYIYIYIYCNKKKILFKKSRNNNNNNRNSK